MEGIRPLFTEWPVVLPSEQAPEIRPLAIGIDRDIVARIVPPADMDPAAAEDQVRRALWYLTSSWQYCRASAAPGAMRYDADGRPVELVTPEQAKYARSRLPGYQKSALVTGSTDSASDTKEVISVQVPSLKVTLPLRPDQLSPVGETVKTVDLAIDLGDGKPFSVAFSGKNFRRALRQVDELHAAGSDVVVILQGRLIAGHRIEGAGLAVQVKTPKPTE